MFIRKKTTKAGTTVYVLVQNRRVAGDESRQTVVFYLGPHTTVVKALRAWTAEAKACRKKDALIEQKALALEATLKKTHGRRLPLDPLRGAAASTSYGRLIRRIFRLWSESAKLAKRAEQAEKRVQMLQGITRRP